MFGGSWTDKKLEMLRKYLEAYTNALKKQRFDLIYIDAFAGTGYRERRAVDEVSSPLFPELAADEPQGFLEGSARTALSIKRPFAKYMFIEKSPKRCGELQKLKEESDLGNRIEICQGDCNEELMRIVHGSNWRGERAVLFLDPFGMQVSWETIEAVAKTRAFDVWILFPISAVNRLLARDGAMQEGWPDRLTQTFGTSEWQGRFYRDDAPTLIEGTEAMRRVGSFEEITAFWQERLAGVFAGVAGNPVMLRNKSGTPLFLLCFAAANTKGAPIAVEIAEHILENTDMKKIHGN